MRRNCRARRLIMQVGLWTFFILGGCVTPGTQATVTSGQASPGIQEVQAEAYNGPKARIAVARFKDKTGAGQQWWNPKIGDGMADQLTTALFDSNRFIVLERETLGDVLTEQDLGTAGRISKETAAPVGQVEGAELLVVGAVTEFEGGASGAGGGLGGYGGFGATGLVLGAIAGGYSKSHMAIDVRIIDARTSRVLAATSVQGEATDVNLGGALGGALGGGGLGAALGGWKNTPIEKALRVCIDEAVKFIVSKTPQQYYHFTETSQPLETKPVQQTQPDQPQTLSTEPALPQSTAISDRSIVREMQNILNSLGYNVGTPDGLAGKKTGAGVSKFQSEHGLEATGQLNQKTVDKLRELKTQGQSMKNEASETAEEKTGTEIAENEILEKNEPESKPQAENQVAQGAEAGKDILVTTKGKTEIMKEPSPLSEILQTVESDVSLEKIGGQGNWIKVKTSQGKEGYVFQDTVK